MPDNRTLGIVGIIALAIVAICFLAYLVHVNKPILTTAEIEKAREIIKRMEEQNV